MTDPRPPTLSEGVRRAALPITTFVQVAASAAVIGPTVAAPLLLQQLQLGLFAVGLFIALVYIGAVFSTQVAAVAVGRLGPIRTSQLSLLCTAIGVLLLGCPLLPVVALGAVVVGLGYGPITPASSQMLARSTDPRHYALVFSVKQTGVPLGGVLAGLIVPPLAVSNGGVGALLGLSSICVVAALCAMPLAPELDRERIADPRWPHWREFLAPVRVVMAHRVLRSMALCSLVFSIVQVSLTSYMVSYLTADLSWTLTRAGVALAGAQLFGVGARIGWGVLADRWLGPQRMLLCLALSMTACSLLMPLLSPHSPEWLVLALLCAYGATAVGWNGVSLATVARASSPGQAATATAGTLLFTFSGVVSGPPVFGLLGGVFGGYGWAFALLALPLLASIVLLTRPSFSAAVDGPKSAK